MKVSPLLPALLLAATAATAQEAEDAVEGALEADREARQLEFEEREARDAAAEAEARMRALAADAQRFEADAIRAERRLRRLTSERRTLERRIGAEQEDIVKLVAALQRMLRRPAIAILFAPDDALETARTAALVRTIRPQIEEKTAAARVGLRRLSALERQSTDEAARLRSAQADLRRTMAALDGEVERFEVLGAEAGTAASAARERARGLAAEAVDLAGLGDAIALPDDVRRERRLRSFRPRAAEVARVGYAAPVVGRIVQRFGTASETGVVGRGVSVEARSGSVVTSPAPGTVTYAGAFRGYHGLVILEHEGDMVTILTGLDRMSVTEGQEIARGAPLGRVAEQGQLYVELRRRGTPVDPMLYIRGG